MAWPRARFAFVIRQVQTAMRDQQLDHFIVAFVNYRTVPSVHLHSQGMGAVILTSNMKWGTPSGYAAVLAARGL